MGLPPRRLPRRSRRDSLAKVCGVLALVLLLCWVLLLLVALAVGPDSSSLLALVVVLLAFPFLIGWSLGTVLGVGGLLEGILTTALAVIMVLEAVPYGSLWMGAVAACFVTAVFLVRFRPWLWLLGLLIATLPIALQPALWREDSWLWVPVFLFLAPPFLLVVAAFLVRPSRAGRNVEAVFD